MSPFVYKLSDNEQKLPYVCGKMIAFEDANR